MTMTTDNLNPLLKKLGTESAFTVLSRAASLAESGKDIINLGIGQPDFRTPDFIVESAIKALRDGHHGYTTAKGIPQLREAVANDFKIQNSHELNSEQILIVPGGKVTMAFAMLLLGGLGNEILYPDPGFPIYGSMARFSGATAKPYSLRAENGFGISADEVLDKVTHKTRLLILNSPANPTGGINSVDELKKLATGLESYPNIYILSDEIYSRLYFDGMSHFSPISLPELSDRTIILDGWSKTYAMTGWRLGWSYWPKNLIDYAERLAINIHSCVNAPTQWAGLAALTGPQIHVKEMCEAFSFRRRLVLNALDKMQCVTAPLPKGAFYAFPEFKLADLNGEDIQNLLLEEVGVATVAGSSFGDSSATSIRLSFANSNERIIEALDRISHWLDSR